VSALEPVRNLIKQIGYADQVGLDMFGVSEHRRKECLYE